MNKNKKYSVVHLMISGELVVLSSVCSSIGIFTHSYTYTHINRSRLFDGMSIYTLLI